MKKNLCALIFLVSFLTSCTGYQLGGQKPVHLAAIESFYVPLAKNHTLFPRIEANLTNEVVSALVNDGTYAVRDSEKADATLKLEVAKINYRQIRSDNEDTLRSDELELQVLISWAVQTSTGSILEKGTATGRTRFFVADNLQTARRNAVPDAVEQAATDIVARLADGF